MLDFYIQPQEEESWQRQDDKNVTSHSSGSRAGVAALLSVEVSKGNAIPYQGNIAPTLTDKYPFAHPTPL